MQFNVMNKKTFLDIFNLEPPKESIDVDKLVNEYRELSEHRSR